MQEQTTTGKDYTGTDLIAQREVIVKELLTITPGTPCVIFDKTEDPKLSHDLAILVIKALEFNYDITNNRMNKRLFLSYWYQKVSELSQSRSIKLNADPDAEFTVIEIKENFTRPTYDKPNSSYQDTTDQPEPNQQPAPAEGETTQNSTEDQTAPAPAGTAIEILYSYLYQPLEKYLQAFNKKGYQTPQEIEAAIRVVDKFTTSFTRATIEEARAVREQKQNQEDSNMLSIIETIKKNPQVFEPFVNFKHKPTQASEAQPQYNHPHTRPRTATVRTAATATPDGRIAMTIETDSILPGQLITSYDRKAVVEVREVHYTQKQNLFEVITVGIIGDDAPPLQFNFVEGNTVFITTSQQSQALS